MSDVEIVSGAFYWVWIDCSTRYSPDLPPSLVVAQPWHDGRGRVEWEGCGTDEGVRVIEVVAKIEPPKSTLAPPATPERKP